MTTRKKIAVVITHGIDEQVPMGTLDSFVAAAWVDNPAAQFPAPPDEKSDDIWFKPDPTTGSLELRRITTRWTRPAIAPDAKGPRIDFFEFYWADLATGTTVGEVWDWLRTLLLRTKKHVPEGLVSAWLVLWAVTIVIGLLLLLAASPWPGGWWHAIFVGLAAIITYLMNSVVAPYVGEVARYVRAEPRNVAMREAIRERGLDLLNAIHDSGAYERIVVVAHSLGAIIAYDLVSLLWTLRGKALFLDETEPAFAKLRAVEETAHALEAASEGDKERTRDAFRAAQREFRLSLRSGGADGAGRVRTPDQEWLISDFITLGSPLTHAGFLLAKDKSDLENKIKRWLFPTCPPQFQRIESEQMTKIEDAHDPVPPGLLGPPGGLFSYFFTPPKTWSMHHAAPFAAVRWTNIFDPHAYIFRGDIISGPAEPDFGKGIKDVNLAELRGPSSVFTHTLYWTLPGPDAPGATAAAIAALQRAINLEDAP